MIMPTAGRPMTTAIAIRDISKEVQPVDRPAERAGEADVEGNDLEFLIQHEHHREAEQCRRQNEIDIWPGHSGGLAENERFQPPPCCRW